MKIIAGNWKMNKNNAETRAFIDRLKGLVAESGDTVILCVPFTGLRTACDCVKGSKIKIGAQNVHWAESGAFTGEISADMLCELGVEYVIVGHSERRQFFGESDSTVSKRALSALSRGLKPIICIGETLSEREAGDTEKVLSRQTRDSFAGLDKFIPDRIIVAYEPVWAIGTGKTATSKDANDTIAYIRSVFTEKFKDAAIRLPILYGGSVNENNAADLFSMKEIDGGLIGGASLDAEKFARIVNFDVNK